MKMKSQKTTPQWLMEAVVAEHTHQSMSAENQIAWPYDTTYHAQICNAVKRHGHDCDTCPFARALKAGWGFDCDERPETHPIEWYDNVYLIEELVEYLYN